MIVRRLWEGERKAVLDFYLALGEEDRRLRFFSPVSDAGIQRYVAGLDFLRGVILGAFDGNAKMTGVLELVGADKVYELALAVAEDARGMGVGRALVEKAWEEVRTAGAESLVLLCLSENAGMRALAQRLNMETRFVDGDLESSRGVPPPEPHETLQSIANEFVSTALWSTAKGLRVARELGESNAALAPELTGMKAPELPLGKPGEDPG